MLPFFSEVISHCVLSRLKANFNNNNHKKKIYYKEMRRDEEEGRIPFATETIE